MSNEEGGPLMFEVLPELLLASPAIFLKPPDTLQMWADRRTRGWTYRPNNTNNWFRSPIYLSLSPG